jgi:hypothetical protein
MTLWALVVYLFIKGALVLVPRKLVLAVSALIAALVHVCCGSEAPANHVPTAATGLVDHGEAATDHAGMTRVRGLESGEVSRTASEGK